MNLGDKNMKNYDSRTYSINDFIEWEERNQLEISPKFQRRSVWSPQAKSFLIDTIIKDKPLPKIFIRATTDPRTRITHREIVDGQQRIRTILSFVKDAFRISKVHSEEYGGMLYSELPETIQADFLKYELSVDLLLDLSDRDVLDIFARLNTYSVSLNKQELLNAKYFGYFKQLVYKLSGDYYSFWINNKIFSDKKIVRMAEAELVTDLLVTIIDGIQPRKGVEKYYQRYDENFENRKQIEQNFNYIMDLIGNLFNGSLSQSNMRTVPNFYGLFVSLYHLKFGIPNFNLPQMDFTDKDKHKLIYCIDNINNILEMEDVPKEYIEFIKSTKDATTDTPARKYRCTFITQMLLEAIQG